THSYIFLLNTPAPSALYTLSLHDALPISARESARAVKERNLVLLEEIQDTVVVLPHDLVLACQHACNVDGETFYVDAVLAESVARVLEVLRGLQQRLGGNAADVGARSTERGLAVDGFP